MMETSKSQDLLVSGNSHVKTTNDRKRSGVLAYMPDASKTRKNE